MFVGVAVVCRSLVLFVVEFGACVLLVVVVARGLLFVDACCWLFVVRCRCYSLVFVLCCSLCVVWFSVWFVVDVVWCGCCSSLLFVFVVSVRCAFLVVGCSSFVDVVVRSLSSLVCCWLVDVGVSRCLLSLSFGNCYLVLLCIDACCGMFVIVVCCLCLLFAIAVCCLLLLLMCAVPCVLVVVCCVLNV